MKPVIFALFAPAFAFGQVSTSFLRPIEAPEAATKVAQPPGPAVKEGPPAQTPERKLKPLVLVPEITVQFSDQSAVPVASLHAQGDRVAKLSKSWYGVLQYRFDLNPKPGAGDPVAVAKRVRIMPGTLGANVGCRLSWDTNWETRSAADGSWGMDLRVSASGAAQTADVVVTSTPGGPSDVLMGYTGVASVDASASLWLGSAYLAAQWTKYWAGGKDQVELAHQLNQSESLSISAIYAVQMAPSKPGESTRPLFLQLGATGKPDFSDTVWTFTLATTFEPL